MTTPADRVRAALAAHDLDHADGQACDRVARAVLAAHHTAGYSTEDQINLVTEWIDREGLALAGAPETRAAARDVVEKLRGGGA